MSKPLTAREIASLLKANEKLVYVALSKLVKSKDIYFISVDSDVSKPVYNTTRITKLYFTESAKIDLEFIERLVKLTENINI